MYVSGKMRPAETIPGMGGRGENDGDSEFKYDIFDKLLRTFVIAAMYPYHNLKKKEENKQKDGEAES
jgi:hypothetical protein